MPNHPRSLPALLALAVAATLQLAQAAEPPLIEAAARCPMFSPNRACLHVRVIPFDPPARGPHASDGAKPAPDFPDAKPIPVTGRLNNGQPQHFRLKVTRREDDSMWSVPPELPYLGQSPSGNTIILTVKGPLEILTPGFKPWTQNYIFVDDRTWRFLGLAFIATSSGNLLVSSATDIGVWDKERGVCISGVLPKREQLRVMPNGCRARPGAPPLPGTPEYRRMVAREIWNAPATMYRFAHAFYAARITGMTVNQILELNTPPDPPLEHSLGNVENAPVPFTRIRKLFPNDVNDEMESDGAVSAHYGGAGTGIDIERIKGSHILIINLSHDDC